MKVNSVKNNDCNTNFGAIIPKSPKVKKFLFRRLNTPKRNIQYDNLCVCQEFNKINIVLDLGLAGRLKADIKGPEGLITTQKENIFKSLLGLSPIRFIKDMCHLSNKYSKEIYK